MPMLIIKDGCMKVSPEEVDDKIHGTIHYSREDRDTYFLFLSDETRIFVRLSVCATLEGLCYFNVSLRYWPTPNLRE